jgi:biotin carboxyl carrier protein
MSKSNNKTGVEKQVKKAEVVDDFVVEYRKYTTELTEKFKNRTKWQPDNPGKILSFIPGTITKIFVKEGDVVDIGTALIILEAMKMKNTVFSEVSGVVKKINIELGEQVSKGRVIFELELT